jgi:hypothetical protein
VTEPIYLEQGPRRVRVLADVARWYRVARDEDAAIAALAAYAGRYAAVATEAGLSFPPAKAESHPDRWFSIAERAPRSAVTDFGAQMRCL